MSLREALQSINPMAPDPTGGFLFCDMEEAATSYYGLCSFQGGWMIWRFDGSSMRYASGSKATTPYATAWTNRASLTYTLPDAME